MDDLNFDGFPDGGAFNGGGTYVKPGAFDYMTGALQTGLALGTSYVSRRMDIDLQTRLAGAQPSAAVRRTTQPLVADHADVTIRTVAKASGMRVGDLLPLVAIAAAGWFFLVKR
jgi:hypothetical protein